MLLFIGNENKVIIPMERVYSLVSSGCVLKVIYDNGDLVDYETVGVRKNSTELVVFDSEDDLEKVLRQFYKACNNGVGAFYFGKVKEVINSEGEVK